MGVTTCNSSSNSQFFSGDSDLTTSPRDENMLKKDVDMFIHKLLIIKFNHIPNYALLLARRLWEQDQCY